MNNAVIYARFSSAKQNEQSIEGQLRYCEQYAANMGYNIVGTYIDRALSGTSDQRPQFQRMIADSAHHNFEYVIVWKLDRFSRNRYDSAIYKNKLKKNGVRVLSATEGIGEGDESIILEAVLESMAEMYSRQLAQNVRRGMNESALKGASTGGTIPLGYKLEDGKLVIDEKTAPIVRFIFESYANGMPKTKIAKELNDKGYRSRVGTLYRHTSFDSILKNKKYIGVYHWDGVEIENGCPAIVDKATFDKCAEMIKLNKRTPGAHKAKIEYQLHGKLFCGHCGAPMVGDAGTGKSGTRYYYYSCAQKKKRPSSCDKRREKKDFIEWYVVEQTLNYVLTADRINYIAERVVDAYYKSFSFGEVKKIDKRIEQIDTEFNKLADNLATATSQRLIDAINKKAIDLENELNELQSSRQALTVGAKADLKAEDIAAWLRQFIKGDPTDEDYRRKIINSLVNAVYLFDDKVVIYFNVEGGKQVSYIEMLEDVEAEADGAFSNFNGNGSPVKLLFILNKSFLFFIHAKKMVMKIYPHFITILYFYSF